MYLSFKKLKMTLSYDRAIHLMQTEPIFLHTTSNKSIIVNLLCDAITKFTIDGELQKAAICHQYIALAQMSNKYGKVQAARNFSLAASLHPDNNDKMTCYQHAINIYKEIGEEYNDTIKKLEEQCKQL